MRIVKFLLLGLVALAIAGPASAASIKKGASLLAIELSRGVGDYAGSGGGGVLVPFSNSEQGFEGQYWYFMAEGYAVNVAAGVGYFKDTETADPSDPFPLSEKITTSSWQVRIGGDRFAQVSDKLQVFAGPGIQFWGGKYKQEDDLGTAETPSSSRVALSGRIGAHILMGENFGLIGHLGQYWGYANVKEGGAETKWLPSGTEGAMGFAFAF